MSRVLERDMTCNGQDACRVEELMPSASSTGPWRVSGITGPNVAGLWLTVMRRSGALPPTSTSTMPPPDF